MASGNPFEGSRASRTPIRSSRALLLSSPSSAPRNSLPMSANIVQTDHHSAGPTRKMCWILSRRRRVHKRPEADEVESVLGHDGRHRLCRLAVGVRVALSLVLRLPRDVGAEDVGGLEGEG